MQKSKEQQQYDLETVLWSIGVGCTVFLATHFAEKSDIPWVHEHAYVPGSLLVLFGISLLPVEIFWLILRLFARTKRPMLLYRLWGIFGSALIIFSLLLII